jgi:predicted transcriptional regulator
MTNYDRRLFRRRKLRHLEAAKLPPKLRELKNRGKLLQILNVILIYSENGIPHQKLAEIVKIDRKTLRKYTKWLTEKELIRREGKHGNYFPTSKSKGGTYASADTLCRQFVKMAFDWNDYWQGQATSSIPQVLKEVTSQYIKPRQKTVTDDMNLERILFDFSNTIGGFITYILIQSMNSSIKIEKHVHDLEEESLVKQKWIGDVMSVLSEYLLNIFIEQTWYHPTNFPPDQRKYTYFGDLTSSFFLVYPDLYKKLEILMQKLSETS